MPKEKRLPNYTLVEEHDSAYKLLTEAINEWHIDLSDARIVLAWRRNWTADKDGRLVLGRCQKASELAKELTPYDFVILLNREVWEDSRFVREKKLALLDHELCHAAPDCDEDSGDQKLDSKGRLRWRSRGHDIEEFRSVVEHHGCYKADLEKFAEALTKRLPLLDDMEPHPATNNSTAPN